VHTVNAMYIGMQRLTVIFVQKSMPVSHPYVLAAYMGRICG